MNEDCVPMKSLLLARHAEPYSVGSRYRTSPTNDDLVHGSGGPGEIASARTTPQTGYHPEVPCLEVP